ncbi:glycoside hydrolase [Phascolomyces articulosus]|uniref:alpha-1,2-Mannosidase n=1 Tax=Phascolomyces articulosus TaxID=60185 RepID=A0AAD5JYB1_9FUNG|nr:glycoside hydrolase [Phascolomyces articulosus]
MFFHGWNNYLTLAYPEDELNPILCNGRGSDKLNPGNININDILGDYSLTIIDTLDTLAVLGEHEMFEDAVNKVLRDVSFNQDNRVQIFETNIRILGGLLSAHILATDPSYGHTIKGYNGGLLRLAQDLADRLIPAFQYTKTGIPYPRVNLRHGVQRTETVETCTAGAGSLVLEFGVLSRLTNNTYYEDVAKRAMRALWNRRSDIDLLGNVINIQTGQWIHTASSTGAGIDSYFEYLFKAYVLFGEAEYLDMFEDAYRAIMQHVRDPSGYLYRNVHMSSGALMATWVDSLSSFWPGLQVLYGDLDSAIKGHLIFYNIWRRYHALPERFDFYRKTVDIGFYPLRPEFIESTYYLYRATRDPFYLHVGEMVLEDLNNRTRLPCGFATIGDVRTGRLEDRMESFLLSETLKYLYLLFDTDNSFNKIDSNFVFTTEGHFLPLAGQYLKKPTSAASTPNKIDNRMCLLHNIDTLLQQHQHHHYIQHPHNLDISSIPYRPETDFAAAIVGSNSNEDNDEETFITSSILSDMLHSKGHCISPQTIQVERQYRKQEQQSFELTFNTDVRTHQLHRQSPKFVELVGGFLSRSLSGLKLEITKRSHRSGGGFQVTRG